DRSQEFDPYALQGRRFFSIFVSTVSNFSTFGRGRVVDAGRMMPPKRTKNINDVYERIMERMEERLDQFIDQFSNRINDMMNTRRRGDRNGRRNKGEKSENPFFEGEGSSLFAKLEELEDDDVADDNYEEAPIFDDDKYEEEIVSKIVGKEFVDNYPNFQEDENNVS
nr:reverse transcriptase domain-containing protein [Tanacetum cinerariifolium]